MLLVTDMVRGTSRLLVTSDAPSILDDLPYPPLPDGTRDAQGVVSRKKQLLPAVLGLLETVNGISEIVDELAFETIFEKEKAYMVLWTSEEIALGFVGDVGDLAKLVIAENGNEIFQTAGKTGA